jgi:hypothetical protein
LALNRRSAGGLVAAIISSRWSLNGTRSLIYRSEVLAIIGGLADLVVEVRDIRDLLAEDDEEAE